LKNKSNQLLSRVLIRSLRITIGVAILILVFYFAANARDIATSSISFDSLSTTEIFAFLVFSVLAYLLFILIWPIAFGKEPLDSEKIKLRVKQIKKGILEFFKQWMRG
jgi:hypothetical protein